MEIGVLRVYILLQLRMTLLKYVHQDHFNKKSNRDVELFQEIQYR